MRLIIKKNFGKLGSHPSFWTNNSQILLKYKEIQNTDHDLYAISNTGM